MREDPVAHRFRSKKAFPAKAGTHHSTGSGAGQWVPAFAGNAVFGGWRA
jgi:hypothetical protein